MQVGSIEFVGRVKRGMDAHFRGLSLSVPRRNEFKKVCISWDLLKL